MPFTEFYMQTTGNNTNAGSTSSDSPQASATNGAWDTATNVFTASSGSPFAAGVSVGDWASVFIDGAATAVFIAQITAVTSTTITVSATVRLGTAPTTSATARSVRVGGAWAGPNITALSTGTTPLAIRINVRAGSYSLATAVVTIGLAGTTTAPIWIRGYKSSPSDLAPRPTTSRVEGTDIPLWAWTSGAMVFSGAHTVITDIALTSARASTACSFGVSQLVKRCRVYNTNANAASQAINAGSSARFFECYFQATTTATVAVVASGGVFDSCVIIGGISSLGTFSSVGGNVRHCVIRGYVTNGALVGSGLVARLQNCTFVGGVNGVNASAAPGPSEIVDCIFSGCSTAGINNTSGTNTNQIVRIGNAFWNCGSQELGFGDSPSFDAVSEVANPLTSPTDMTPIAGALSLGAAGGLFEGESYTNYLDIGAVQRQSSGGGSSIAFNPVVRLPC